MSAFRRRAVVLFLATIAAALLILAETIALPVRIVCNISPSAPLGLYRVSDSEPVQRGDLVLVRLPPAWQAWAAGRGYIGETLPLIKRVAGLGGDHVCARDGRLLLEGRLQAVALERDGRGRPLPRWRACRRLWAGEVFLLMDDKPDSFDSRYFGPLGSDLIEGRLTPLRLSDAAARPPAGAP